MFVARCGGRGGGAEPRDDGVQYRYPAKVNWHRHITPLRVAVLIVLIFYVSEMIVEGMWFSRVEGEGVSIVEFFFIPCVLLYIDLVMHGFDIKPRMLFWSQLGLLALAYWSW